MWYHDRYNLASMLAVQWVMRQSQELDSIILTGPFPLRMSCGSAILQSIRSHYTQHVGHIFQTKPWSRCQETFKRPEIEYWMKACVMSPEVDKSFSTWASPGSLEKKVPRDKLLINVKVQIASRYYRVRCSVCQCLLELIKRNTLYVICTFDK